MPKYDLTGQRFTRLVVESEAEPTVKFYGNSTKPYVYRNWNCNCDCGNKCVTSQIALIRGFTKSCGCLKSELSSARRKSDLTGRRFTKLLVIKEAYTKDYSVYWECLCDCGNVCYVPTHRLTTGTTKSCGCIMKDIMGPKLYRDITGLRSGKLVAIEPTEMRLHRQVLWRCECDCGGETYATTTDFLSGHVTSCGCVKSKGEEEVAVCLKRCKVLYKKNYMFKDLYTIGPKGRKASLMFDFGIIDKEKNLVFLIEFQGIQHYKEQKGSNFGKQQRLITDQMKKEYCKKHGIPLYEIRYDEDVKLKLAEILCKHVDSVGSDDESQPVSTIHEAVELGCYWYTARNGFPFNGKILSDPCESMDNSQLRRDKLQAISDTMWEKIKTRIECGLNWEEINKRGGINVNKLMAYTALPGSATTEWTDFDIDRCVVANDFEGEVTDLMMYIKPDYTHSEEICTVKINHTDGCGMILPSEAENNFIFRMPYTKGLACVFDFMKFCEEKGVEPVITDPWGQKHNLRDERITMIFFVSMTKMWKYYDSWDAYKAAFKRCGCKAGIGNVEEEDIDNASTNYQFIDSLESFTDAEVKAFTKNEHDKIMNISKNKNTMLRTLKADKESDNPYKAALAYYPEFLWDSYTRTQLKDIRKRMLLDAKSGKIKNLNKRLYAVPDLYAVCEWLFCGIEKPEGLLKAGEVAAKTFIKYDKADLLRSPS